MKELEHFEYHYEDSLPNDKESFDKINFLNEQKKIYALLQKQLTPLIENLVNEVQSRIKY